jgi:predicted permease
MSRLQRFVSRLVWSFRHGKAERELSREIGAHLQLLEDRFVAEGMSRSEARYAAKRAFGGIEAAKEQQRDARAFRALAGWPMDLKLGARMLVKSPGLTVIAVLALAVAFGAGATYLEFVNGMLRPTLSFPGGDRLIGIVSRDLDKNTPERRVLADFRIWHDELTLIDNLGASQDITGAVTTSDGRAERVDGVRISTSAFRLIPASPLLGRPLVEADENPSAPPVAVIGEALWQARFSRDPGIIGKRVDIEAAPHTIVGVMPRSFGFPVNHVLWVPFRPGAGVLARGEGPAITIFGRLREGASIDAAQAELEAVARDGEAAALPGLKVRSAVQPYVGSLDALDGQSHVVALYAVNFVFIALLAVCAANVATLVFGRTVTREAEITVRTALGASRGRVVSQLVAEAVVLASVAAAAGLAAASVALKWVRTAWEKGQASEMPFWWDDRLGIETLLYTALLVVLAAVIVGGIPALKATGPRMQTRLKSAGAGSTMTFGRLWTSIIVGQVAVTVVFLLSVVGMAWSFRTIIRQFEDVAFERTHYLTAWMAPDDTTTAGTATDRANFIRRLQESPAIEHVTYTTRLPGADQEQTEIEIDGAISEIRVAHVGPDFFETFGRGVVQGRTFTNGEIESGANVAVVDEAFVRHVLGGRSAVGLQMRTAAPGPGDAPGPWLEIIGVTADMSTSARKTIKDARVYRPIGAIPAGGTNLVIHARAGYRSQGLGQVAAALREAAATAPPALHVTDAYTLDGGSGGDVVEYVFGALGLIGAVALLLSTAGIYALVSFTLARRTREIGIRTALGASPRRIVTGILSRALWQIGIGVVLGVLPGAAIVASVSAADGRNGLVDGAAIGAAVAAFVLLIAAASCSVPLRRALRVEPTQALRAE